MKNRKLLFLITVLEKKILIILLAIISINFTSCSSDTSSDDDNVTPIDCSNFSIEISTDENNYSASVQITGGETPFIYDWSNGDTGSSIGSSEDILNTGTYSVTVTDANDCTFTSSINIVRQPSIIENSVECIGSNSSIIKVLITNTDTSEITEKGVCYSLTSNPTVDDMKVIFEEQYLSEITIDALNLGTTYYVRGYAINNTGVSYGDELVLTTNASPSPFAIGQKYEGGIIAHINCDGTSGYILNTDVFFDTSSNTIAIATCNNLISNGYDDWYLPNATQLQDMYRDIHKTDIFKFQTGDNIYDNYWSSSKFYNDDACGNTEAYYLDFDNGDIELLASCFQLNLLPIRNF